jgi:hypothetical protein
MNGGQEVEKRRCAVGDRLRDRAWLWRFRLRARLERRFGVPQALDADGGPQSAAEPDASLPKRIWIYWRQGWDEAPDLVRRCRHSWETRNPGWEVVALDAGSAARLAPPRRVGWPNMSRNHEANFLRIDLLAAHGGIWADATTFCAVPLDAWLPPLAGNGFFAFARPGKDRLLATWFLAATPRNPLVLGWQARCDRYARLARSAGFYFWFPYLFADLCRSDAAALRLWKATPRVSAGPSHWVQWSVTGAAGAEDPGATPVHKLDWRLPMPAQGEAGPLAALLKDEPAGPLPPPRHAAGEPR